MSVIKHKLKTRDVEVVMESQGFDGTVNVDDMTSIHYENIEGEILTVSSELNRVGILKSLAEDASKRSKLDLEIYSAKFNRDIRREASLNSNHFLVGGDRVKLTENSVTEALYLDKNFQDKSRQKIDDETNVEFVSSLYWALNEKAKKLDKLMYVFNKGEEPQTRGRGRE